MKTVILLRLLAVAVLTTGCASRQHDLTANTSAVCEVHHTRMVRKVVPAGYGLFPIDASRAKEIEVAESSFPNARDWVNPGCKVGGPDTAIVFRCTSCELVRADWVSNHKSRQQAP